MCYFRSNLIHLLTSAVLFASGTSNVTLGQSTVSGEIDFVHEIVPILKQHCSTCHGGNEAEGEFSINNRERFLEHGAVVASRPAESHLLELIKSTDVETQMPPKDRPRLSAEEIALIQRWIEAGVPWDADYSFALRAYDPPLSLQSIELPAPREGREHPVDRLLDAYLSERQIAVPDTVDDRTFMRRVYLDLIGLLPTLQEQSDFLNDSRVDKRERLIDALLAKEVAYADHWLSLFNDLLRNDYSGTGFITGGRTQVTSWLYASLLKNKPFDQMTRELISPPSDDSRGFIDGIKWRGEVSAGQTVEIQFAQSIAQSFLGINMKCASCHDSFIDRWTLREAYGLAAIYASSPLELHRCDKPTGDIAEPSWIYPELGQVDPQAPREERLRQLADLLTHQGNGRFTRTIVNRLWYRLMGRGLVHPLDAMQNEPWNAELLDYLAGEFIRQEYDLKALLKLITTSQAYQSRCEVVAEQELDTDYVYRGPRPRRMTAEQIMDAVWQLTGAAPATFDAQVSRIVTRAETSNTSDFSAKWIWGKLENNAAPGGESITFVKDVDLEQSLLSGGAIVTCDNGYRLFVNGREISRGDDWVRANAVPLGSHLRKGSNQLVVIGTNAGTGPNAAGLYLEGRLVLEDGSVVELNTNESWQWSPELPQIVNGKIQHLPDRLEPVVLPVPVDAWSSALNAPVREQLVALQNGETGSFAVRASLLKNNALMKSLGRPMREQIVSMRPTQLTTLEAIDLANEPSLAAAFGQGAETWLTNYPDNLPQMVEDLFTVALCRPPTVVERELFLDGLGQSPGREELQDMIWALCMLPEFLLVR